MKLFSTSCETLFLGWDAPLLPRVVEVLSERFGRRHRLDLTSLLCVLPTARSVHRLHWLLHRAAAEGHLDYDPPEIITLGQLPERLYRPPQPVALEFEQTLAWARVLRGKHPDDLQPLMATLPAADPISPWLELAGSLRRLHEELSASRLAFADVVDFAETDSEKRRWKLLAKLFSAYQCELHKAGLCDPHWGRREAVLHDRCQIDRTVALIGASDLSDSVIAMLRSLDSDLISLVAAPASQSFRFDEFGCVDTAAWLDQHLPIDDEHLIAAGDIADQATAVAQLLGEFGHQYSPDQITVGVTDESHVGPLEIELRGCGVTTFRQLGWTIGQTAIGSLLELVATYLRRRTWQSFAAMVRHADVGSMISTRLGRTSAEWITDVDTLLAEFFPVHTSDSLSPQAMDQCQGARDVLQLVDQWLSVFETADQSIAVWTQVIDQWLVALYEPDSAPEPSDSTNHRDPLGHQIGARTSMALRAARRVLGRFAELNRQLDFSVSGTAAIEMLAARLAEVRVAGRPQPDEVEIAGWLDLALDDAPLLVVMGFNQPFVPQAVTSDPFLPGSLRSRLRMADNDRRYARDAYAMHLMLSTRLRSRFIVGRTGADQSPTPQSRLLAAAAPVDAARRVRRLLGGVRDLSGVQHRWDEGPDKALLPIPQLSELAAAHSITTISVTAFRDYLTCPYRFFLRHVLKLKPLDDASGELAANQFGNLIHGALERFGQSADCNESSRAKIEAMLIDHLHDFATEYYGDAVSTAVTLQIAQAERRLKAVAKAQAERVADGWRIHASEASVDESDGAGVDVDGRRMGLRGRFDRIDYHADTDRWAILDYKTHGYRPEKKHLRKTDAGSQWIDLQLPLYRMMIPYLGIDADPDHVQLGYFNVSEKDVETRINIAEFSPSQLQQADQLIRDCVHRIWAADFAPTSDRVQFDDYAMILQSGVASRLLDRADSFLGQELEA